MNAESDPHASRDTLIRLSGLDLTLTSNAGPVHILNDIALDVGRGETVGIVGPSGSGKTSLLMVVAGLERASSGVVEVAGAPFHALDEDAIARVRGRDIGIVFQDFHLIPNMSALENVALPLELAGKTDPFGLAEDALVRVGLVHRLSHYPGEMSGGEQQRVALARAVAPRPKLLLADEPTGNLDGETGAKIMDLLFDIQTHYGTTLMLVTHETALAEKCRRILRIADGRIAEDSAQSIQHARRHG